MVFWNRKTDHNYPSYLNSPTRNIWFNRAPFTNWIEFLRKKFQLHAVDEILFRCGTGCGTVDKSSPISYSGADFKFLSSCFVDGRWRLTTCSLSTPHSTRTMIQITKRMKPWSQNVAILLCRCQLCPFRLQVDHVTLAVSHFSKRKKIGRVVDREKWETSFFFVLCPTAVVNERQRDGYEPVSCAN